MSRKLKLIAGIVSAAAVLAGCDNNDDPPPTALVRFVHASADAPNVDIYDGTKLVAADVPFKGASGFIPLEAGSLDVRVDGLVPGGPLTVIGPASIPLTANNTYSVVALGEVAAIGAAVFENSTAVASGSTRAQVLHGAPDAPQVDVYVTAPNAPLTGANPLGSFAFGEDLGPVTVPAGDYEIRVTLPNDPSTVVFDSGTVTFASGADLLVVAVENTGPGSAPISLLVVTSQGAAEILDNQTPAQLRVIHASPDTPPVDIIVNDDFANPVLSNVPYTAVSDYLSVPAGTYNVKVTPAGNPGVIAIDADLDVAAGTRYSVYARGPLATVAPFVLVDDNRSIATQAKLRIVHMAPSAGSVDLYLTAPGENIATISPSFTNVDFLDETGYLGVAGGTYDVTVTLAGTKTPAIGPATITIADGDVYTAAARDAPGGGAPFGLILMDDF